MNRIANPFSKPLSLPCHCLHFCERIIITLLLPTYPTKLHINLRHIQPSWRFSNSPLSSSLFLQLLFSIWPRLLPLPTLPLNYHRHRWLYHNVPRTAVPPRYHHYLLLLLLWTHPLWHVHYVLVNHPSSFPIIIIRGAASQRVNRMPGLLHSDQDSPGLQGGRIG